MKIYSATTREPLAATLVIPGLGDDVTILSAGSEVSAILIAEDLWHINGQNERGSTVSARTHTALLALGPVLGTINEGGAARG